MKTSVTFLYEKMSLIKIITTPISKMLYKNLFSALVRPKQECYQADEK